MKLFGSLCKHQCLRPVRAASDDEELTVENGLTPMKGEG